MKKQIKLKPLKPSLIFKKAMKKKKRLSQGIRKYIRRQKMVIKAAAKNKDEQYRLVKDLLNRFYGSQ